MLIIYLLIDYMMLNQCKLLEFLRISKNFWTCRLEFLGIPSLVSFAFGISGNFKEFRTRTFQTGNSKSKFTVKIHTLYSLDCKQSLFFFRFSKGSTCTSVTRNESGRPRRKKRAWSFACLGRFAGRTKKKERLLIVYVFLGISKKIFPRNSQTYFARVWWLHLAYNQVFCK